MVGKVKIINTCYRKIDNWIDLVYLSNNHLVQYDVAAINLACAVSLPGYEVIDVEGCLNCLDKWAVGIANITERGLATEFRETPARYGNSEPLYRMVALVLGLKKFCGVVYNKAKIGLKPSDPFDLDEQFIYGAIQGPGGTCATLPIVYAAVGRRLGYPVKLVLAKSHMFCRWDDPATGVQLNIEGTTQDGVNNYCDAYYREWPYPITVEEERAHGLLQSLEPRQELAAFVHNRAMQWREHQNYRRAIAAALMAMALDKQTQGRAMYARALTFEWERKLLARQPFGFPKVKVLVRPWPVRWPGMPWASERHLRYLEAVENVLNDPALERKWWAPLRAGKQPLIPTPPMIVVNSTSEGLCTINP